MKIHADKRDTAEEMLFCAKEELDLLEELLIYLAPFRPYLESVWPGLTSSAGP